MPNHWRTIEYHLCDIFRSLRHELDENSDVGDKIVRFYTYEPHNLNLTEISKLLAERLK